MSGVRCDDSTGLSLCDSRVLTHVTHDEEQWREVNVKAGNMGLVKRTLHGIAARSSEEGVKAFGKHARTIRLGRALWQTPDLDERISREIEDPHCDYGPFPQMTLKEVKQAERQAKHPHKIFLLEEV